MQLIFVKYITMQSIKLLGSALMTLLIFSCAKSGETGEIVVKMIDAPIQADSVNVEIVRVDLHSSAQGWISLPTQGGIYNLLELQHGVDTTLVPGGSIPAGKVNQMRLILGQNNRIVVDSVSFPLLLSSQDETGLKLNLNYDFQANTNYEIKFDFVADESVILQGNGSYRLKPVLKKVHILPL